MRPSHSLDRREWLQMATLGIGLGAASSWFPALAQCAARDPERRKSVILLWMNGGPSTIDLWDLKPGHDNGGPFREIATAAPGVRISEHLPQLAKCARDMALIRSMTSKEGDHGRATQYVKTGYVPQGAIRFPTYGAALAHELYQEGAKLPAMVSINTGRYGLTLGGGFLGPKFSPLMIAEGGAAANALVATLGPDALKVPDLELPQGVDAAAQARRLALLRKRENQARKGSAGPVIEGIRSANEQAVELMHPDAAAAFHLEDERDALRDKYGRNLFGQGCLLARRLVQRGVPFVEVSLGDWDTHQNNFEQVAGLSATLDSAFATLIDDLRNIGLLESTLILCLGEFGRTPRINGAKGRDHWPGAWSAVLAGGGVQGGQVVGSTSRDGASVAERPVTVPDLVATACKLVGVDPRKQNMSNVGRPIRIADPQAKPILELI